MADWSLKNNVGKTKPRLRQGTINMVRIHRQRAPLAPAGAARHTRDLEKKKKNPYKVIMEQVTEKRRKLKISVSCYVVRVAHGHVSWCDFAWKVSTTSKPPQGYTFIPAGDPRFTSCCKEIARADGLMVYYVSVGFQDLSTNYYWLAPDVSYRQQLVSLPYWAHWISFPKSCRRESMYEARGIIISDRTHSDDQCWEVHCASSEAASFALEHMHW